MDVAARKMKNNVDRVERCVGSGTRRRRCEPPPPAAAAAVRFIDRQTRAPPHRPAPHGHRHRHRYTPLLTARRDFHTLSPLSPPPSASVSLVHTSLFGRYTIRHRENSHGTTTPPLPPGPQTFSFPPSPTPIRVNFPRLLCIHPIPIRGTTTTILHTPSVSCLPVNFFLSRWTVLEKKTFRSF